MKITMTHVSHALSIAAFGLASGAFAVNMGHSSPHAAPIAPPIAPAPITQAPPGPPPIPTCAEWCAALDAGIECVRRHEYEAARGPQDGGHVCR